MTPFERARATLLLLVAPIVGLRAALATPSSLRLERFRKVLAGSSGNVGGDRGNALGSLRGWERSAPRTALAASWLTLRALAHLRPATWRTTCLYRSVAGALALRGLGVEAGVEIGVARTDGTRDDPDIQAHAWLVSPGLGLTGPGDDGPLAAADWALLRAAGYPR